MGYKQEKELKGRILKNNINIFIEANIPTYRSTYS